MLREDVQCVSFSRLTSRVYLLPFQLKLDVHIRRRQKEELFLQSGDTAPPFIPISIFAIFLSYSISTVESGDATTEKGIVRITNNKIAILRIVRRGDISPKSPRKKTTIDGRTYFPKFHLAKSMETFEVKRGVMKSMGGNAGLAKLATEFFDNVEVDADGNFTASFGIMTKVSGVYTDEGKLKVDVEQD